ncbi:MAG: hypothetical protein AAGG72_05080 [Pseudomonadota bacterium]
MSLSDSQRVKSAASDDDSVLAFQLIEAAWLEGEETGIPEEMLAYAAIFAGLRGLVECFGEDAVAGLARRLEQRVQLGEFSNFNTRQ